jgi:hypothetical protein
MLSFILHYQEQIQLYDQLQPPHEQTSNHVKMIYLQNAGCDRGAEVSTDYWQSSNPDFNSLSPEEKDGIYQDLHNQIDSLNLWSISFAHIALSCGDTGPALESGLANQEFVIAFICRFQVILLHGYINFPTIDDLWQSLLDQYLRIGLEGDS